MTLPEGARTAGFDLTGVLASLSVPLAQSGISVFAISTYNTDYLFVKDRDLDRTRSVLSERGHVIKT